MLAAAVVTAGVLLMTAASEASTEPEALKQRLQAIASSTVLFGHQSVGDNVLEGLRAVAREQGVELRIAEVRSAAELRSSTFGHARVADNGDPRKKLASFTSALGGGDPDVAFVKFCYVDFNANTDAQALFAVYDATVRDLRAKHPRTTFVHVTAPLVAAEGFAKAFVKKLLGKSSGAVPSNARREEFNALIRSKFARDPVFDLARIESTDASGRRVSSKLGGKEIPMLAAEYTDDGGHLNAEGGRRAAIALVQVIGDALTARAEGRAKDERPAR